MYMYDEWLLTSSRMAYEACSCFEQKKQLKISTRLTDLEYRCVTAA